ncbi:uncharacterized protein rab11fip1a [Aplochiton taeniatus]
MSLADQSQQFYPTNIQVTVHQGRNLRIKGKNGTNDAYAIMQMAKDKFSTSVAEKCVAPIWKEEATFDLPLFHQSNAERCTLHVVVMHRAQVGLDKHLGQAVINLLDLHENKSRKKTDWYKLVDKNGKEDKARGEVLLDIQFMRNNMSASMFDLSMHDKPRSRIAKLKDKVRGKKKDGFSDSASAIVPSVSKGLTDSEGEEDAQSLDQSPGDKKKKKSKLKSLFAPKSNLQRNVSQSMSTLGTLPEKNSSVGGSRSSGLNVESPDVKKKFKFLGHKRTGSSDSKVSLGPFSLLGRSKQSASDQNSLCINGNHVYAEEDDPKTGSTLSLNSSGQGSAEDLRKHSSDASVESLKVLSVPTYQREAVGRDVATAEQRRPQQEEERRQVEEKRLAEDRKLQKKEEEEGRRRGAEDEARKKRLKEEEEAERRRRGEEEEEEEEEQQRKRLQEEQRQRAEEEQKEREEARRAEERKQQEDASMTDRISSLFGMNRKKEEKKEEAQQSSVAAVAPKPAPRGFPKELEVPGTHNSSNPFEEIALSPDPPNPLERPGAQPKTLSGPQTPSASVFLNRGAKVSAVKPRSLSPKSETSDSLTHRQPFQSPPSPTRAETSLSSVPESPDTFANLHTSLAPPKPRRSTSEPPRGSTEDLTDGESSPPAMADKKRQAPKPPGLAAYMSPIREIENPAYVEPAGFQLAYRPPVPLPDYEMLFPQKRHGVQGHTQWDHIIAEVNQKKMDHSPLLIGREMSVDGPEEPNGLHVRPKPSVTQERVALRPNQASPPAAPGTSWKKTPVPAPPLPAVTAETRPVAESVPEQSSPAYPATERPRAPVPPSRDVRQASNTIASVDGKPKLPIETPGPTSRPADDQRDVPVSIPRETPTAKPRQTAGSSDPAEMAENRPKTKTGRSSSREITRINSTEDTMNKKAILERITKAKERFVEPSPFPSDDLLTKDPWAQPQMRLGGDNLFTGGLQTDQTHPLDQGMTPDDLDSLFASETYQMDPFAGDDGIEPYEQSPAFQRGFSSRRKKRQPPAKSLGGEAAVSQYPTPKEEPAVPTATTSSLRLEPGADVPSQYTLCDRSRVESVIKEGPTAADPFSSSPTASVHTSPLEPLQAALEGDSFQNGGASGGKTMFKAWVAVPEECRPYSQLTQEELITMVVKQQGELTKKDAKIVELEEYIDNLIVRVIEEKPTILMSMTSGM